MRFYRRMLRISQTDHASNEELLAKERTKRTFVETLKKRQFQILVKCFEKGRTGRRGSNWQN